MAKKQTEQPQPTATDAEEHLLSALLEDPSVVSTINLDPDDFYSFPNRCIYEAIKVVQKRGDIPDIVMVKDELERAGNFQEAGGSVRLADLMGLFTLATRENVKTYANLIQDKAIRRKILNSAREIAIAACTDKDTSEILKLVDNLKASATITDQTQPYTWISEKIVECSDIIEKTARGDETVVGLKTGFIDIDKLIGGMKRGNFIIIAARPSQGKTSLAANIAVNVATVERPVIIFSLETTTTELINRIIVQESKVDSQRIMNGRLSPYDWDSIRKACCKLSDKEKVCVNESCNLSPFDINRIGRILKQKRGDIGCIIVDYLQLMRPDAKAENRTNEITAISRALKMTAKELDCPVIALSQLNRSSENRTDKMPKLSDLRDSGAIEQDADIVLFIHRPEEYGDRESKNLALVNVAKGRNGPTGIVRLVFLKECFCFLNMKKGAETGNAANQDEGR